MASTKKYLCVLYSLIHCCDNKYLSLNRVFACKPIQENQLLVMARGDKTEECKKMLLVFFLFFLEPTAYARNVM